MWILEPNGMYMESIGGIQIFRPRSSSEWDIRIASERHLRSRFTIRKYDNKDDINSILQHQFAFYSNELGKLLPVVASRDFLEFVLFQFDLATQIEQLYKEGELSKAEDERWKEIGGVIRRALKYIAERVVLLYPDEAPSGDTELLLPAAERIWICAEEMVNLYMESDQTFSLFPDDISLEILPVGEHDYFAVELRKNCSDIHARVRYDLSNRHRFISDQSVLFDIEEHDKIIGKALKDTIGVSYREALGIIAEIIRGAQPASNGFPVPFIHKAQILDLCAERLDFARDEIKKVVAGFTISKQQMELEGREVWKPKQEYRAYRRGFFEFPHPSGEHLAFSKEMAAECFAILRRGVIFGQFPAEWRSESVNKSLSALSNLVGEHFEKVVEENLRTINFIGLRSAKKSIGVGEKRIVIPPDVGEIDFVGYSEVERIILIAECKIIRDSFEPRFFRDDVSDFVRSKKAYINQLRKKVEWARDNQASIYEALVSTGLYKGSVEPEYLAGALITYLPTIASCFIDDFPCISLTELMLDYESTGSWPYNLGIYSVKQDLSSASNSG
jgi:hypothetical protein